MLSSLLAIALYISKSDSSGYSDTFGPEEKTFKTCSDSSFCRRYRSWKSLSERPTLSVVSVTPDSGESSGPVCEFSIKLSSSAETTGNYEAVLSLYRYTGAVRVRVSETNPARARYAIPPGDVIVEPDVPVGATLHPVTKSTSNGATTVVVDKLYQVEIQHSPFQVRLISADGRILQVLNSRNFFAFEKYRTTRTDGCPTGTSVDMACHPEIDQRGSWEETFGPFTDPKLFGPSAVGIDVELVDAENVFGLPERTLPFRLPISQEPQKDDEEFRFFNVDAFQHPLDSKMGLYGSIPMVTAAHTGGDFSGFLWLNPSETYVSLSRRHEAVANVGSTWVSETGIMDMYMFVGPTPFDVLSQYHAATGLPALPPAFALGFHQSKWGYESEGVVASINRNFDKFEVPMDVMWLDIQHTVGNRYLTWNDLYSHPRALTARLAESGRKLVAIVDPHVKTDPEYFVFAAAAARDVFVKNPDGVSDFTGNCWPGSSSYIDFSQEPARALWKSLLSLESYKGSSKNLFIWNDMNEPSVFDGPEKTMPREALHANGVEHRELHNLYGMSFHRATFEALLSREDPPKRPFVLSRSFFAGSHRYGPIWTGDNMATWGFLKASVPMLLSLAVSGMSFAGADVGGFEGNPEPELFVRWHQLGALAYPFYRSHAVDWAHRREPWEFGKDVLVIVRAAIQVRYALMPYWYTLFADHALTGKPITRPLFYNFPKDRNTVVDEIAAEEQVMVGDSILVCGVYQPGQHEAQVYLPGKDEAWYDFYELDSPPRTGGQHVAIPLNLYSIPMFVRAGSIVPMKLYKVKSTEAQRDLPITLRVFLADDRACGYLYIDDGESMEYLSNSFAMIRVDYVAGSLAFKVERGHRNVDHVVIEAVQVVGGQTGDQVTIAGPAGTCGVLARDQVSRIAAIKAPFRLADALSSADHQSSAPVRVHT